MNKLILTIVCLFSASAMASKSSYSSGGDSSYKQKSKSSSMSYEERQQLEQERLDTLTEKFMGMDSDLSKDEAMEKAQDYLDNLNN